MNLRATFATASLVFASTLTAATYSMDVLADTVAIRPIPINMAVKQNPIPATHRSVSIGSKIYSDGCNGCHGPSMIAPTGAAELPNNAVLELSDGALFWKIKHGHGDLLNKRPRQVWHLVNYLRSK